MTQVSLNNQEEKQLYVTQYYYMISGLAAAVSNDAEASFSDGMRGLDTTLPSDCSEDTSEAITEQGICL